MAVGSLQGGHREERSRPTVWWSDLRRPPLLETPASEMYPSPNPASHQRYALLCKDVRRYFSIIVVLQSFDRKELVDFSMGLTPWRALYVVQIGLFKMDKKESDLFVLAF